MSNTRMYTDYLLYMIEEEIFDAEHVVRCFTEYLSEATVKNMMYNENLVMYYDGELMPYDSDLAVEADHYDDY